MKTVINIKTDKDVKEKAQKIAKKLGLPLSTIVNASLKQLVRNQEVLFSVAPQMTKKLENLIAIAEDDYKKGKNIAGPFNNTKDLMKYLHN